MRLRFYRHQRTLRAPFLFAFALTCIIVAWHIEPVFTKIDGLTSIFRSLSQPAQEVKKLSMLVLALCGSIFVVVATLLVYVIIRFQHRAGDEASKPPPVYGSEQILLLSYWKLISLPPVIINLFIINRWQGRSRRAFNQPITNRNSTDMEATSS
jgi:heme/copper-type cytochrome/quinol oxidase subunit 2